MDDFILFHQNRSYLKDALLSIGDYLADTLRLALKDKAIICAPVTQGISFLGFRIFPGLIRLSGKSGDDL